MAEVGRLTKDNQWMISEERKWMGPGVLRDVKSKWKRISAITAQRTGRVLTWVWKEEYKCICPLIVLS